MATNTDTLRAHMMQLAQVEDLPAVRVAARAALNYNPGSDEPTVVVAQEPPPPPPQAAVASDAHLDRALATYRRLACLQPTLQIKGHLATLSAEAVGVSVNIHFTEDRTAAEATKNGARCAEARIALGSVEDFLNSVGDLRFSATPKGRRKGRKRR